MASMNLFIGVAGISRQKSSSIQLLIIMSKKLQKANGGKIVSLAMTVRGMRYRLDDNLISQISARIEDEGSVLCVLEPEPENEVDPNAIKVIGLDPEHDIFTGLHIAYLGRPGNGSLAKLLRAGGRVKSARLISVDMETGDGELDLQIVKPSK